MINDRRQARVPGSVATVALASRQIRWKYELRFTPLTYMHKHKGKSIYIDIDGE